MLSQENSLIVLSESIFYGNKPVSISVVTKISILFHNKLCSFGDLLLTIFVNYQTPLMCSLLLLLMMFELLSWKTHKQLTHTHIYRHTYTHPYTYSAGLYSTCTSGKKTMALAANELPM